MLVASIMRAVAGVFLVSGCVSMGDPEPVPPPVLTQETPVDEVVTAAIQFGGETLEQAKKILKKRQTWDKVHTQIEALLLKEYEGMAAKQLINAIHLYQLGGVKVSLKLVKTLIQSDLAVARQVGWQLAARFPSMEMASMMEEELSRAIWESDESKVLLPEMANAAIANRLNSTYTLMKQGLMLQGDPAFADAMRQFDPRQAASDFVDYLSHATIEDLRQLNQSTVNLQTCIIAIRHLKGQGAPLTHPKLDYLFLYAVSRNQVLAELANEVIEKQIVTDREHLAFTLARLPAWIQVAYLEEIRNKLSPGMGNFLADLKRATAHKEVIDEIDAIVN